ncbi:MAG: hypothetical protein MUE53_00265 [Chitinophagales bacterium]|jgi:hypothetical protein|nr:hypothetical protein [Chitinophagales bacterium]
MQIETQIASILAIAPENLNFEFFEKGNIVELNLYTKNPLHQNTFLFHSLIAVNKQEALEKMLGYIQTNFNLELVYTIEWAEASSSQRFKSFFRGRNIVEIIDKFFYNRQVNSYTIYQIVLNPIA